MMAAALKVPTTWLWCLIGDTLLAVPAAVPVVLHGVLILLHCACFAFIRCCFSDFLNVVDSCTDFVTVVLQFCFPFM